MEEYELILESLVKHLENSDLHRHFIEFDARRYNDIVGAYLISIVYPRVLFSVRITKNIDVVLGARFVDYSLRAVVEPETFELCDPNLYEKLSQSAHVTIRMAASTQKTDY